MLTPELFSGFFFYFQELSEFKLASGVLFKSLKHGSFEEQADSISAIGRWYSIHSRNIWLYDPGTSLSDGKGENRDWKYETILSVLTWIVEGRNALLYLTRLSCFGIVKQRSTNYFAIRIGLSQHQNLSNNSILTAGQGLYFKVHAITKKKPRRLP